MAGRVLLHLTGSHGLAYPSDSSGEAVLPLWDCSMPSKKYFAYHVDLYGAAHASYELKATDDAAAVSEARYFLKLHPSIEVWLAGRFVARLPAQEPANIKGH